MTRSRISRRRYCMEWRRYSVRRIASPRCGRSARPTARTPGSEASSRWRSTSYSRTATARRQLLERVHDAVRDEEPDEVARRADRQLAEPASVARPVGEGLLPRQVEERRDLVAEPEAREGHATRRGPRGGRPGQGRLRRYAARPASYPSDSNSLRASGRWWPDVTSRKAAPSSGRDPLGVGHQALPDPPLADAGVDDEGDDPREPLVGLEPRDQVERDEADDLARGLRDEHVRVRRREPLDPRGEVGLARRVALVGEERGEAPGVGRGGGADGDGGGVGHAGMVPAGDAVVRRARVPP